jgi:NodT family efflux transporter outer membrane factor (OMF) lipoprotein
MNKTPLALATAAALLAGCAGLPGKDERPAEKPPGSYATARSFAAPVAPWPADAWWTAYGDPQLDRLIEEGLAGSPSVAVARARLQKALAQTQVANAATLPQVSANGSVTMQRQSENYLTPKAMTPDGWNDYGRATLDFSWELDLWGKNKAALAAAISDAEAARADAAQARLALSSSIAAGYAELARLYAALDTAMSAQKLRAQTADLFRQRRDQGLETLGSVRQAEARQAAAENDLLATHEQILLQKNRIAALTGAGPDRGLAIARPAVDLSKGFGLPERLAADLLGRRPDIAAARMRAEAQGSRIDQARAAFYPNVNLSAFIGVLALGLNALTAGGSAFGSIGPALSLPIFDGGRLKGSLKGAEADYAEAVANYDKAVVQALQEVADAATSQRALGAQLAKSDQTVAASREAWRVQNDRYRGGLANYLEVLQAEESLLADLRVQTDLRARSFSLEVALVKALGGGYANQN